MIKNDVISIQRDSYICDGRNMERTPEFTRGVLFMFLPS